MHPTKIYSCPFPTPDSSGYSIFSHIQSHLNIQIWALTLFLAVILAPLNKDSDVTLGPLTQAVICLPGPWLLVLLRAGRSAPKMMAVPFATKDPYLRLVPSRFLSTGRLHVSFTWTKWYCACQCVCTCVCAQCVEESVMETAAGMCIYI